MISTTEIPPSSIIIVDLFRSGDDLRICSEEARTTDGQHCRPVRLQRITLDQTVQKPLRAAPEFEDNYLRHLEPKWAPKLEPKWLRIT